MGTPAVVFLIIAGLVLASCLGYGVSLYNGLVEVRNNVDKAWKNIDVLLLQRYEELPKLIDACKAYLKHESSLLTSLTQLRTRYLGTEDAGERTRVENELNRQLGQLKISVEAYPDLKASENFLQIQRRVGELETNIAARREFFNDSVNLYNIRIVSFPDLLLAKLLNYQRHEFLEVPEEKKQDVKMDFS
jgi:LemA protein